MSEIRRQHLWMVDTFDGETIEIGHFDGAKVATMRWGNSPAVHLDLFQMNDILDVFVELMPDVEDGTFDGGDDGVDEDA